MLAESETGGLTELDGEVTNTGEWRALVNKGRPGKSASTLGLSAGMWDWTLSGVVMGMRVARANCWSG